MLDFFMLDDIELYFLEIGLIFFFVVKYKNFRG